MIDSLRERALPLLLAVVAVVAVAAALYLLVLRGGDPTKTLDEAFRKPIGSADVALDVTAQIQGVPQLQQPIRLQLRGPYTSNGPQKLPKLDVDASLTLLGRTITAGFVSTGDNAWVRFNGEAYEAGPGRVRQLNEQLARQPADRQGNQLEQLGIDPRRWLRDAEERGDAPIAGVETTHISAAVDVPKLLDDLNRLAERSAAAAGGGGQATQLTPEQRRQVEEAVKEPRFDVYVGKDDGIVRRISADLRFELPEAQRQQAGGAQSGTISFSIEFANVGRASEVRVPQDARPLSELQGQIAALLGGATGAQGGAGGGQGGAGQGGQAAPPGQDGAAGGSAEERLRRVRECLEQAGDDQAAQERCAAML